MSLKAALFPAQPRCLPGERWLNVLFRTLHLVGVAGLGAGFLYPAADESWRLYLHITLVSGVALAMISIYGNGIWLVQMRGLAILFKIVLLVLVLVMSHLKPHLFLAVVVISGWISHAPARVRYYSPYHGRRVEKL